MSFSIFDTYSKIYKYLTVHESYFLDFDRYINLYFLCFLHYFKLKLFKNLSLYKTNHQKYVFNKHNKLFIKELSN